MPVLLARRGIRRLEAEHDIRSNGTFGAYCLKSFSDRVLGGGIGMNLTVCIFVAVFVICELLIPVAAGVLGRHPENEQLDVRVVRTQALEIVALVLVCISAICTLVAFASYMPATAKQVKERFSK